MIYVLPHVAGRSWAWFTNLVSVSKRHLPKWLMVIVGIALAIPGPQDELLVAIIIAAYALWPSHGAMRHDLGVALRQW